MRRRSEIFDRASALLAVTLTSCALAACAVPPIAAQEAGVETVGDEVVVRALALLGVPYKWGGTDPARGLDCSGLVRHVFMDAAAVELPRRSEEMGRVGRPIKRAQLQAGDLLFFNTRGRSHSHVAIYMGEARFVHAPAQRGVVRIESMDDAYWKSRYNGARRIDMPIRARAVVPAEVDESTPMP